MATVTNNAEIHVKVVGTEAAKAQLGGISASMKSMAATVVGALGLMQGFRMLGQAISKSYQEAEEARLAHQKLEVMLRNSGKAAQFSAKALEDHAEALSAISNFDDEDILLSVTTNLLKYKSIASSVLPEATKLTLDLAEAAGGGEGSLAGAARMLGMALERPTEGLSKMKRAGVMLTPEVEKMVKSLEAMGKTAEAQELLLRGLESTVGGLSSAMQTSSAKMRNAWNNLLEALGKTDQINGAKLAMSSFFTSITKNFTSAVSSTEQAVLKQQKLAARIGIGMRMVLTAIGGVVATVFDVFKTIGVQFTAVGENIIQTFWAVFSAPKRIIAGENVLKVLKSIPQAWSDTFTDSTKIIKSNIANWTALFSNGAAEMAASDKQIEEMFANMNKGGAVIKFEEEGFAGVTESAKEATNDIADLVKEIKSYIDGVNDLSVSGNSMFDDLAEAWSRADNLIRQAQSAGFGSDVITQLTQAQTDSLLAIYSKYYQSSLDAVKQSVMSETEIIESEYQKRLQDFDSYSEMITTALQGMLTYQILTEQEYNAKLAELSALGVQVLDKANQDKLNKLAEYNAKHESVIEEAAIKELSAMEELGQDIKNMVVNGFAGAFADAIVEGENFAKSMQQLFKDLVRMILAELAKLAILGLFKSILGVATGGLSTGAGASPLGDFFGSGGYASIGKNPLGMAGTPGYMTPQINMSSTDARIDRLARIVEQNRPIVYTQVIEGVPFHNAVKRAETQALVM